MKKNSLNKQLVRALAVGISAGMTLQPIAVLAIEDEKDEPLEHVVSLRKACPELLQIINSI